MTARLLSSNDLVRLQEERDAAIQEYRLVMNERDSVHKEIEKLHQDLNSETNKCDLLEKQKKKLIYQNQVLIYQNETLRREIVSSLHDRDEAIKERNEIQETFNVHATECRMNRKDSNGNLGSSTNDSPELEALQKELESTKKTLEKVNLKLSDAIEEAEVARGRRDWAFSERDKTVFEKESLLTLCERLRKERDCAISDLSQTLQSLNELKKEHHSRECSKDFNDSDMRRRLSFRCFCKNSNEVTFNNLIVTRLPTRALHGLTLDRGFYISKIDLDSATVKECSLAVGDRVLSINNKNVNCFKDAQDAMIYLNSNGSSIAIMTTQRSYAVQKDNNFYAQTKKTNSSTQTDLLKEQFVDNEIVSFRIVPQNSNNNGGGNGTGVLASAHKSIKSSIGVSGSGGSGGSGGSSGSATDNIAMSMNKTGSIVEKTGASGGTWELIRGKLDLVRDKIHSRATDEKKKYSSGSPPSRSFLGNNAENDAIAALDSVLDSYHHQTKSCSTPKGSEAGTPAHALPHNKSKCSNIAKDTDRTNEENNNAGTWPKARSNVVQHITGTVTSSRKKERMPLSILLDKDKRSALPIDTDDPHHRHSLYRSSDPNNSESSFSKLYFSVTDSFEKLKSKKLLSSQSKSTNANRYVAGASDGCRSFPAMKNAESGYCESGAKTNAKKDDNFDFEQFSPSYSRIMTKPPIHYNHPHSNSLPVHLVAVPKSSNTFSFEPPYSLNFYPNHQHNYSVDVNYHLQQQQHQQQHQHQHQHQQQQQLSNKRNSNLANLQVQNYEQLSNSPYSHEYEVGTFPRKKENARFRIPSNPSVTSKNSMSKISSSSFERSSERGSPVPSFHVEVLSPCNSVNKRNSLPPDYCWPRKPVPGELRRVHIYKSCQTLGININCLNKGIFVSTVRENSLASQVGLQIGDQLLEVCGINMRNATYSLAERVLRHCSNSITMLVEYRPDKYHENEERGSWSYSCDDEEDDEREEVDDDDNDNENENEDNEITPHNSPDKSNNSSTLSTVSNEMVRLDVKRNSNQNSLVRTQSSHGGTRRANESYSQQREMSEQEPRFIRIETQSHSNLGISLVGGNAVGIFVHSVGNDSLAARANLRTGDRILDYNGISFRTATAEQAAYEFAKPTLHITLLVLYDIEKYNEIKNSPGDSLYIRCGFDRNSLDLSDSFQLNFYKDDILYVDSTMFNGVPGHWRAWKLDHSGNRTQCGIIPSKFKVDELHLRRNIGDIDGRSSTAARRSFFRKKKSTRNDSKDSKELASFSNNLLSWASDSGTLNDDFSVYSYQRVERIEYPTFRPILIVGPLYDCVSDKLIIDFPDQFRKCVPEMFKHFEQNFLERNDIIDFKRKGNFVECTTISSIETIGSQKLHCILDVPITALDKLHRVHIYPIVVLIKFKSTKQIREIKDSRYQIDKVSTKAAKEMYEHSLKLETEYRHFISAIIPAGSNMAYVSTQIKSAVDIEQNKSLWVPCKSQL